MAEVRCFVGLPAPAPIQSRVKKLVGGMDRRGLKYRWTTEANLHITICFLGVVEDRRLPDACRAVQQAIIDQQRFEISCRNVGAFSSPSRPRVIFVGIDEGREELQAIHDSTFSELKLAGFNVDGRRYQPHLTIGRTKANRFPAGINELIESFNPTEVGRFPAEELILYSSELEKSGPIYTPLARFSI